jgi:hypothetical protein
MGTLATPLVGSERNFFHILNIATIDALEHVSNVANIKLTLTLEFNFRLIVIIFFTEIPGDWLK